ncbi:MAG TPA: ribonuclease III [Verrucomicrobiae bacterium]|nr:ribonuclease III [Verrucomicrobiae bacterium]
MKHEATRDLNDLQGRIGYQFRHPELLDLALTHPSLAHELGSSVQHNQRLEFLGDAVLQLILTRELYDKFPALEEGPLTKARAQLVNRNSLAEQARRLDLGRQLKLSRGEELNGGRERPSALADAYEALLGALLLDGGFDVARDFALREFHEEFGEMEVAPNLENPKGELQELLQAESPEAPMYRLESVHGPDHDREFECAVFHRGTELGRGKGKSKKAAESKAAFTALTALRAKKDGVPAGNGA